MKLINALYSFFPPLGNATVAISHSAWKGNTQPCKKRYYCHYQPDEAAHPFYPILQRPFRLLLLSSLPFSSSLLYLLLLPLHFLLLLILLLLLLFILDFLHFLLSVPLLFLPPVFHLRHTCLIFTISSLPLALHCLFPLLLLSISLPLLLPRCRYFLASPNVVNP